VHLAEMSPTMKNRKYKCDAFILDKHINNKAKYACTYKIGGTEKIVPNCP